MDALLILAELCVFGIAWWLGLYLLVRNPQRPLLQRAAAGLLAYAFVLVIVALEPLTPPETIRNFSTLVDGIVLLPAIFWAGALLLLLPPEQPLATQLDRIWRFALLPMVSIFIVIRAFVVLPALVEVSVTVLALLLVLVGFGLVVATRRAERSRLKTGIVLVGVLFVGLSGSLIAFFLGLIDRSLGLLALSVDLVLLGVLIAAFDTFSEGETLRWHITRSAIGAFVVMIVITLPVVLFLEGQPLTFGTQVILFWVVTSAIGFQTLAEPFAKLLDQLVFARVPQLSSERAALREVAEALPLTSPLIDPSQIDATEFARMVRRALSSYGDLSRLATSPLIHLPPVSARLLARQATESALERAAELKAILGEQIDRLKPRSNAAYGISDEWRYYNALYYPYVLGLKPYSQRTTSNNLPSDVRHVLEWFRDSIPERTLYNWQNTAARLIADELRRMASGHEAGQPHQPTALPLSSDS